MTREEFQAATKTLAWRKGDITVVPYGIVWGSMSYDSQRSMIGDYCVWIQSPDTHPGEPDYSIDAKSSRFGFDILGPSIPFFGDAKIDGKFEFDFQGQFVTRNKPGFLLRHAYIEAKNDDFRVLVGQTWDVISPLAMPILNYTSGSAVGNLAYRRAQFRVERFLDVSDATLVTLQASLNGNVVTDFVSDPPNVTSADIGPYPDIQTRAAVTLGRRTGPDAHPATLGIGAHVGQQDFDFRTGLTPDLNVHVPTWSVNADIFIPITGRLGFQGEFFTGENLSDYMGGILQGVDRVTHHAIHATGGWAAVWFDWRPNLRSNTGFGIDDPLDADMVSGPARTYNRTVFTNLIWDATKNLQLGIEADWWRTGWLRQVPGEALRVEFATRYKF